MTTLIYRDITGSAPRVLWRGLDLVAGEPVPLDPAQDGEIIEAARGNPFFELAESSGPGGQTTSGPEDEAGSDTGPKARSSSRRRA